MSKLRFYLSVIVILYWGNHVQGWVDSTQPSFRSCDTLGICAEHKYLVKSFKTLENQVFFSLYLFWVVD